MNVKIVVTNCQKCKQCLNGLKSLGLLIIIVIVFVKAMVMVMIMVMIMVMVMVMVMVMLTAKNEGFYVTRGEDRNFKEKNIDRSVDSAVQHMNQKPSKATWSIFFWSVSQVFFQAT